MTTKAYFIMGRPSSSVCREYGKHVTIESFDGHQVTLQRGDGLTFPVYLSPYPSNLQQFVSNGQWESAQRLCSSIKVKWPRRNALQEQQTGRPRSFRYVNSSSFFWALLDGNPLGLPGGHGSALQAAGRGPGSFRSTSRDG